MHVYECVCARESLCIMHLNSTTIENAPHTLYNEQDTKMYRFALPPLCVCVCVCVKQSTPVLNPTHPIHYHTCACARTRIRDRGRGAEERERDLGSGGAVCGALDSFGRTWRGIGVGILHVAGSLDRALRCSMGN